MDPHDEDATVGQGLSKRRFFGSTRHRRRFYRMRAAMSSAPVLHPSRGRSPLVRMAGGVTRGHLGHMTRPIHVLESDSEFSARTSRCPPPAGRRSYACSNIRSPSRPPRSIPGAARTESREDRPLERAALGLAKPCCLSRLEPSWRRLTPDEARAIFDANGLAGPFWALA